MSETPSIATDLLERAHRRPNGELAWPPADAAAAVVALAAAGYAVLGGEWWVVLPDGAVWPAVPTADGRHTGVYGWSLRSDWDQARESWEAFCARAAAHTLAVLRGADPRLTPLPAVEAEARRARPDLWPLVRYNITFVSRDRYERSPTTA